MLARDPQLVMEDLRTEAISDWTARNVYHVVYDTNSLHADAEATEKARREARRDRLARGKSWEDFHRAWSELRPCDEALAYFGSWPEGIREQSLVRI